MYMEKATMAWINFVHLGRVIRYSCLFQCLTRGMLSGYQNVAGVKKYSPHSPILSILAPIELCVKWYVMHQRILSRSRITPCMSMKGGLSVMGDCQCAYTGHLIYFFHVLNNRQFRLDSLLGYDETLLTV